LSCSSCAGLPKVPFFALAAISGVLTYVVSIYKEAEIKADEDLKERAPQARQPESVMPLLAVDPLELEIGYGLLSFADETQEDGGLLRRVTMVRRQIALELGLVLPHVRIRDNIQLPPTTYAIKIRGVEVAQGKSW